MKIKFFQEKYQNFINDLNEKINKIDLNKIFENIKNKINEENFLDLIKIIKLKNKISYFNFILNLQNDYTKNFNNLQNNKINQFENLKKIVINKFDELYNNKTIKNLSTNFNEYENNINQTTNNEIINENNENNNNIITHTNNFNENKRKSNKSDLVNYESEDNFISKSISNIQSKFQSDLSSFNFNDDSLPNKDIQNLSPPELIKS